MKQVQISLTQESQPVEIRIIEKPRKNGEQVVSHLETLPGLNGNTATILNFNESDGQTIEIK